MIRCLIIDDEQIAQQILEQYVVQAPNLMLVAKCRNALEAFAKLEQHPIDLIFLDIEMPLIDGLRFLKTLTHPPRVILTTAYADYALQGYELNVVDYLLKPYSLERFLTAIAKVPLPQRPGPAGSATLPGPATPPGPATLPGPAASSGPATPPLEPGHLIIKIGGGGGGLVKIPYDQIRYIEASRDYAKIQTTYRQYLVHLTMKSLEEQLPPALFIRIHKSYIVSLAQIKMIRADTILIGNDQSLPLSTHYKESLLRLFRK